MLLEVVLIVVGFILLVKGADFMVRAATSIAKKIGMSEMLIGLTIVAIGTSLPEIFITITSSIEGRPNLIIGNAIGSCICNFLLVIGIVSFIKPCKIEKRIAKRHLPIGMMAMVLLFILGNTNINQGVGVITRWQGIMLIILTILYIIYSVYEEKQLKNQKIDEEIIESVESKSEKNIFLIIIYMILGIVGLKFGADFVVNNAVLIAQRFGLSESVIGFTIVAIGTALPEIITGIIATLKNESDIVLGNISGSNVLNLCLLIGIGAIINPLKFPIEFNSGLIVLMLVTVLIQLISTFNKNSEIGRSKGIILIATYFTYIISLL